MGQVTLSTDEYHDLINQRQTAENELAAAKKAIVAARSEDPTGRLTTLVDGFKAALEVVCFAVGNLPAESYKGWPHDALRRTADAILQMPECGSNERDLFVEFKKFAGEARTHELRRAQTLDRVRVVDPAVIVVDADGDGGSPG